MKCVCGECSANALMLLDYAKQHFCQPVSVRAKSLQLVRRGQDIHALKLSRCTLPTH